MACSRMSATRVLWVRRSCLSGEVLLARSRLRSTQAAIAALLGEVKEGLPVPIRGVISDGQQTKRLAVAKQLPGVTHQFCQFHDLREAAKPIYEADRHSSAKLKQQVRGVRPIERALEGLEDEQSQAMHGYCLAVRSSLDLRWTPTIVCLRAQTVRSAHSNLLLGFLASRKKGGAAAALERTATPPHTWIAEDRRVVACPAEGLCPRS